MRQRILYAQAETNTHWTFAGGQLWSLATEGRKGIPSSPSDILTPLTVDPNYVPGFVWARQYGFRVVKSSEHASFGISAENPQLLYSAALAGNTPYAVLGSAGNNGGAYNTTINGCSPATSIVNYTNQQQIDSAGNIVNIAVPVYKTFNSCANVANLSFNQAPDVLVKVALDPGLGHFEVFGIAGFAHETVYPGETTNSNLYGGYTDVAASEAATIAAGSPVTVLAAPALTTAGAYKNNIKLGGVGGSLRIPLVPNKLTVGAKGLYGPGVGRYGDSTLSDVTADSNGALAPIHNASGLFTVEATPTPRLTIYLNYGGDYAGRADFANANATTLGSPSACFIVPGIAGCQKLTALTGAQIASGSWGATWKSPSLAAVGYGSQLANNSSCLTTANPGYNGSSTGYYPGGSCGASTRERAGDHRRLLVRHLQGRARPPAPGHPVRLCGARGLVGSGGNRRRAGHRRQGHRQHVLDHLPLLPAVSREPSGSATRERGSPQKGLPLLLLKRCRRYDGHKVSPWYVPTVTANSPLSASPYIWLGGV